MGEHRSLLGLIMTDAPIVKMKVAKERKGREK
jgi:hypothetical protein